MNHSYDPQMGYLKTLIIKDSKGFHKMLHGDGSLVKRFDYECFNSTIRCDFYRKCEYNISFKLSEL